MCWLFHKWGRWVDGTEYEKRSTLSGCVMAYLIAQTRRCERCGKLQRRFAKLQ